MGWADNFVLDEPGKKTAKWSDSFDLSGAEPPKPESKGDFRDTLYDVGTAAENLIDKGIKDLGVGYKIGESGIANTLANIPMLLNQLPNVIPTDKNDTWLKKTEDYLRGASKRLAPNPEDLATDLGGKLTQGIGAVPAELVKLAPFVKAAGPVAGFAAASGLTAADQGPLEASKEAAIGATLGKILKVAEPLAPGAKAAVVGASGGGIAALQGGDASDITTNAVLMSALGSTGKPGTKTFKSIASGAKDKIIGKVTDKLDDMRPAALGVFTLRNLAEIAEHPQLSRFSDVTGKMSADFNNRIQQASKLSEKLYLYKNKEALADVVYPSTLEKFDPSKPKSIQRIDPQEIIDIKRKARADKALSPEDAKNISEFNEANQKPVGKNQEIQEKYNALDPEGKQLYGELRDSYTKQWQEEHAILSKNIEISDAPTNVKTLLQERLNEARKRITDGPYFPLSRFGEFTISAKDPQGNEVFSMRESRADQKALAGEMAAENFTDIRTGKKLGRNERTEITPKAISEMELAIKKVMGSEPSQTSKSLIDQVRQLYLKALPDVSIKKSRIHRKGTAGFSEELMRTYQNRMFHGAHQLAKATHNPQLREALDITRSELKELKDSGRLTDYLNEFEKRYEWIQNPESSPWAQNLNKIGFTWHLAGTPAAAMVNLSQTVVIAFPVLGARYGYARAAKELAIAGREALRSGGIEAKLKGDDLKAYRQLANEGAVEKTQAHNVAELSETPDALAHGARKVSDKLLAYMFHRAEVWNRETTLMAAYRLARQKGIRHEGGINESRDLNYDSHFDYGNLNRARVMQGSALRVLSQFKQYSIQVSFLMGRSLYKSVKGSETKAKSPELEALRQSGVKGIYSERAEARRRILGVMGMTALAGGIEALPGIDSAIIGMNLAHVLFGDEDEPYDAYNEFRNGLNEAIGDKDVAAILARGSSPITGADVTSRISLGDLWLRRPNRELEAEQLLFHGVEQVLGPSFGLAGRAVRGGSLALKGEGRRALEIVSPKFIRSPLQAERYSRKGATTVSGKQYVTKDEFSKLDIILRAIGFTPEHLSEVYSENEGTQRLTKQVQNRRRQLLDAKYAVDQVGTAAERSKVNRELKKFSKNMRKIAPGAIITPRTVAQSRRVRDRRRATSTQGINVPKGYEKLRQNFAP